MQRAVSTSGYQSSCIPATQELSKTTAVTDSAAAMSTSALLIISFPDFNLWPLVAIALVPLLLVIARRPIPTRSFLLGWLAGAVFFYGSCHWLTYSMIQYGGLPVWLSYLLLIPGALVLGLFPAVFAFLLAHLIRNLGFKALFLAAFIWPALEWMRLGVTGQLWNAIGYAAAYQPALIQSARWGGVYAVSFIIVVVNAAVAFLILQRTRRSVLPTGLALSVVGALLLVSYIDSKRAPISSEDDAVTAVVALQPNVPMEPVKSPKEVDELVQRHITMSEVGLSQLESEGTRLVIWPESPMNFAYAADAQFRELIGRFARTNNTSVLFNSQEPAGDHGVYNSALLVNEQGVLVAQYDKIRLMPFGEYVPVPSWLPGASLVSAIVGEFVAGANYTLMPVGNTKAGVFICIESAYPWVPRNLSTKGADVLINISNDGYLGPTAVMQQHLANAVFRAVENNRPVLRVTNTGISTYITQRGKVTDKTKGFEPAIRTWEIGKHHGGDTPYSRYGDIFPALCSALTLMFLVASKRIRGKG